MATRRSSRSGPGVTAVRRSAIVAPALGLRGRIAPPWGSPPGLRVAVCPRSRPLAAPRGADVIAPRPTSLVDRVVRNAATALHDTVSPVIGAGGPAWRTPATMRCFARGAWFKFGSSPRIELRSTDAGRACTPRTPQRSESSIERTRHAPVDCRDVRRRLRRLGTGRRR